MNSREECVAHIIDMQNGGSPMELRPGLRVEHHADCNLIDSECEWSPCEIVRHDKDGWWFARFGDGQECLIHAIECLPMREEIE